MLTTLACTIIVFSPLVFGSTVIHHRFVTVVIVSVAVFDIVLFADVVFLSRFRVLGGRDHRGE